MKARLDQLEFKVKRKTGYIEPKREGETDLEYFNRTIIEGHFSLEELIAGSYSEEEKARWNTKSPQK